MKKRTTYFISDLHLQRDQPNTTAIFLRFLREQAIQAEALYILGDFFEMWVGDDDGSPFNLQIMAALKQATDGGLSVYFMRGNRDFLIGRRFAEKTGVRLLDDPTVIDLYGQRILLMHGDSLCILDQRHQNTRRFYLNPRNQKWALMLLPLFFRRQLGRWARRKSRNIQTDLPLYITDVVQEEVEREMRKHRVLRLIHGHTHRPGFHDFKLDGQRAQRVVLGAWHQFGSALLCNDSAPPELLTL